MNTNIESPAILIFEDAIISNIKFMQDKANYYNLKLRPHIKTHKSVHLAKMQIDHGAVGITASKVDEALVFIEQGFKNVTVAYPIISRVKLKRILEAADKNDCTLNLIIDSLTGFHQLCDTLIDTNLIANVYLKIDVGLNRCGIDPNGQALMNIAYYLHAEPMINFMGILSHAGQSYAAKNQDELEAIITQEIEIMKSVKHRLEDKNIPILNVSIGATPSILHSTFFDGITEIRPGNYILMDQTPLRLNLIEESQVAIRILSMVVSENDHYYIIDCGSKILTSDKGAHGQALSDHYGACKPINSDDAETLYIERLSEEHGFIKKTDTSDLAIGDQILIIPNHSCAVMNQFDEYHYIQGNDVKIYPIDARGKYH